MKKRNEPDDSKDDNEGSSKSVQPLKLGKGGSIEDESISPPSLDKPDDGSA